ncbi:MAG: MerR family transcriptional regulator [Rothia sp. (in: high G+C Gram-positive bacteria)]|uniref:transcriptional regulator FtsR n=1 Tax=Rothia sp. (in: high G+C Gram-positive bacteria) TaxID=1885016 RepID=UPI0026E10AE5|nr:MerR family transcriptional regulator [Rothia sp. (in: high G+C Gram-positive bacteria)]MDO5751046.1 MerR family transcriptional regulator [Rothia sp. (in: high G+C Gram-positive bacteria)]
MNSHLDENVARAEALKGGVERGEESRDPRDVKSRTIGQVLSQLDIEFPAITASKIRFLEDRGLVQPLRTEKGYRKYSQMDIERLRYILTMQRDHYMPLKVIRQHLLQLDAGQSVTTIPVAVSEEVLEKVIGSQGERKRTYTLQELRDYTGASADLMEDLLEYDLIEKNSDGGYDEYDMITVKTSMELTQHGIQPRHLRSFKTAAEREIDLVEIAVAPLASRRDSASLSKAQERANTIRNLCLRLHASLVEGAMPSYEAN